MGRVPELTVAVHGGEQTYVWANLLRDDYVSQTDTESQTVASNITLANGFHRTDILSKSGVYTATISDDIIKGDTSGGAFSITLPPVATATGKVLTFIRTGAGVNALTIDGDGAETIDGAATNATMDAQYDSLTILCDGMEWFIIARKIA